MWHPKNLPFALLFCASLSSAAADERMQSYDIPAQSLHGALQKLADQAGIAVFFSDDQVAGKSSPALKGRYSPREALQKLLDGSGLTYRFTAEDSVAIKTGDSEGAVLPKPKPGPINLDPMVVTATKIETPESELPEAVAVIDAKQISNMNVRDLSDVLRRAAGVDITRAGSYGIASVNLRGLGVRKSSVLINGQYADFLDLGIGTRNAVQTIDWDDVDRIEIVRGAGSALYGPNAMGGVVNIITKDAPEEANVTRPFFVFDSLPTFGGGVSTGGTIDKFNYLLNVKYLSSDGYKSAPQPAYEL